MSSQLVCRFVSLSSRNLFGQLIRLHVCIFLWSVWSHRIHGSFGSRQQNIHNILMISNALFAVMYYTKITFANSFYLTISCAFVSMEPKFLCESILHHFWINIFYIRNSNIELKLWKYKLILWSTFWRSVKLNLCKEKSN